MGKVFCNLTKKRRAQSVCMENKFHHDKTGQFVAQILQ